MKQHITRNARDLYLTGLSTRQVAVRLGVGYATVYRWCKDIIRTKSKSLEGEKHPLYKGGHINESGYRVIWVNRKLVPEHRHLMEVHLGRKLGDHEVVHHINENKLDNRVENLEVMRDGDHTIHHHKGWASPVKGRKLGKYSEERRRAISEGIRRARASTYIN